MTMSDGDNRSRPATVSDGTTGAGRRLCLTETSGAERLRLMGTTGTE